MEETITLDGRKFFCSSQGTLTAGQEVYILGHLSGAGAVEVICGPDGVKYTADERAKEMLTRIYLSGRTHNVLAGYLVEQGRTWNLKDADANAVRFAAITNAEEKNAMRTSMVEFVIGVCSRAGASAGTLLN